MEILEMLEKSQEQAYSNQQCINQILGYNNVDFSRSSQAGIIKSGLAKIKKEKHKMHKITTGTALPRTDRCLEKLEVTPTQMGKFHGRVF